MGLCVACSNGDTPAQVSTPPSLVKETKAKSLEIRDAGRDVAKPALGKKTDIFLSNEDTEHVPEASPSTDTSREANALVAEQVYQKVFFKRGA